MTSIYFVRHAQPDHNEHHDRTRPLTEEGIADSKKVTELLKDKQIDLLMSSPYKRSVDTVAGLAEATGLEIHTEEDFRERNAGSWLGDDFKLYIEKQWKDFNYHIKDGECLGDVQRRNIRALVKILEEYKDKNIVIGTHGTALSSIINYYYPDYNFDSFMRMIDYMPYIIRLDFENTNCVNMEEELIIEKEYNKNK